MALPMWDEPQWPYVETLDLGFMKLTMLYMPPEPELVRYSLMDVILAALEEES